MDDQRFGVAHVGQVREELHRFDEADPRGGATLDAERQDAARAARKIAPGQGFARFPASDG